MVKIRCKHIVCWAKLKYYCQIKAKDLSAREEEAYGAFKNATGQVERMNVFVQPIDDQAKVFLTFNTA